MNRHRIRGASRPLLVILLLVLLLPVVWTWFTLTWSYSEGERAGILQKFSRKGWLCKTYEGELAQYIVAGVAPQIWNFTVRDERVAEELRTLAGSKLQLHYTEHVGVPTSCFGDTGYYVDGVVRLDTLPVPAPGG
jgi:hypothetical protein